MKQVNVFFALFPLVNSSIKIITDRPQSTGEGLFERLFMSMSSSISFIPTGCEYKYRHKIISINLKILVMGEVSGVFSKKQKGN